MTRVPEPFLQDPDVTLLHGDVLDRLRELPDESVDCVITSPPYWGLRDYGTGTWEGGNQDCDHLGPPFRTKSKMNENWGAGYSDVKNAEDREPMRDACGKCGARRIDNQIGLEPTPDLYVARMVEVFREVRRVLAAHGTCWINMGDGYVAGQGGRQSSVGEMPAAPLQRTNEPRDRDGVDTGAWGSRDVTAKMTPARGTTALKPKDLVGIPWRLAFALQADGWYLRADIIWAKPNPMPESVTDRPTKAHEYVFLLAKRPRYWFDQEAVRERYQDPREGGDGFRWYSERYTNQTPAQSNHTPTGRGPDGRHVTRVVGADGSLQHRDGERWPNPTGRNIRSVWEIATQPYPEAHFATYPEELVRRCVLAGCAAEVCRECGKPRERIVETNNPSKWASDDKTLGWANTHSKTSNAQSSKSLHRQPGGVYSTAQTLGWSDCGCGNYRPGRVLDPFVGSGTTCLVARNHGRHAIGIDLRADYLELAARRLQQLSLLAESR